MRQVGGKWGKRPSWVGKSRNILKAGEGLHHTQDYKLNKLRATDTQLTRVDQHCFITRDNTLSAIKKHSARAETSHRAFPHSIEMSI